MHSAYLSMKMDEDANSYFYIIIETPHSGAFDYLRNSLHDTFEKTFFYLPNSISCNQELSISDNICFWNDENVTDFSLAGKNIQNSFDESFLFLSPYLDLSDQFESLITQFCSQETSEIARVLSFINANELLKENSLLQSWLDAVAHFSDAMCITSRSNENGKLVGNLFKRYKEMRYPMETYMVSNSQKGKINSILNPTVRRISHIFDSPELLEDQESPLQDPYLVNLANGKREKVTQTPFAR